MRRARWKWVVVGAAFAVIIGSWALGLSSFITLANPWFNPKKEIASIRKQTPRLYVTDDRNSRLYKYCQDAAAAIRESKPDTALAIIRKGLREDPGNPLFDYLMARAYAADNEPGKALESVKRGNAKGVMSIYSTNEVTPDKWDRIEIQQVNRLAREMAKGNTDMRSLISLFDMGQKMVFCKPADFSVVSNGLFIRRYVADTIVDADSGKLNAEAREFFTNASRYTGPAWALYEDSPARMDFSDPRTRLMIAMRMRRRGSFEDFVEAYLLSKDLQAQATARYAQRRVKLRPADVFAPKNKNGAGTKP